MTCSFCAHTFNEDDGERACRSCASFGGCRKVKCPRCGYEMPQTPNLLKLVRSWRNRKVAQTR